MGSNQSKSNSRKSHSDLYYHHGKLTLKERLSVLKTGSLKRNHQLRKDELTESDLAIYATKKWNSETTLDARTGGNQGPITEEDLQVVPARVEEIPEDERGEATVNLVKVDGVPLGLTVSGGADKDGRPRVSNLRSTGIAARSDQLQVGDIITSVNGIRSTKLKHGEIISLLKNISEKVCLEIEYLLPPTTVQTSTIIQKTTEVFLQKEHGSFGFVLRGGNHGQHCRSRPLVVTHIRPDSPAAREGTLKTGDRIISIGSTPLIGATLQEVINEIQSCGDEATMTIEYDVSVMEAVTNASGPLLIEVSKVPGAELGITMAKSTYRKKPVICIDRVKPASISDRCGALHIGDHILSIDNISMATSSVREASDLLQSSSDQVKLEILPVSHLSIAATPFSQNRFTPLISSAQSLSALNTHRFRQPHGGTLTSYGRASSRMSRKRMQRPKYAASAIYPEISPAQERLLNVYGTLKSEMRMSLASTDFLSNNQVVHTEVTEVQLLTSDDITDPMTSSALPNFGIQLQGGIFSTELLTSPPFINFIEPDRPADRSGVLQSGDRLLTVNGYQCEDCTLDEVTQMLSDAYLSGMVVIEVEFDVAESVVPSSGTFHAKLPKRRGVDLGIVVGASSDGQDSLMILEVRRGSVAHRTGTLEAGDRLLAIDGVRLDGVSSEDAHALLASAEDVVRLKIRKDEDNSEDGDSSSISYTVELKRHGGPLGITISGTEETFDPIIISGLTPGGLADRTGAIHEGDKILSINNVSLRAKPLSDAIDLLQNAGESVVLKIKRQISEKPRKPSFATSTINRNPSMNEPITELSDPEDDILPPPMGPLPDHTPTDRTSTPKTPSEPPEPLLKGRGVRPGPAGAASVDSAVDSWGDGSDAYRTRSSTGSHQQSNLSPNLHDHLPTSTPTSGHSSTRSREQKKMDSNLRHFDKMRSKFEPGAPRTYSDTWGTRAHIRSRTNRSPERRHPPSTAPVADWQRALEDLKSVGQSTGYLHDLESKLTIGSEPRGRHQVFNHRRQASAKNTVSPSVPLQFHRLTLFKENMNEDFGFSLSDGQIEPGVFVHTVRPGGPAHRCGVLPYDRLLQVNSTNLHDSDCSRAIPIISSSRDRLDVLVSRYHGNTGGMATHPLLSPPVHLSPHMRQNDVFPTM